MLELQGVSKTFYPNTPNEVRSLQNVGLIQEQGSFVIVIGTNGSGKSTLLNAIAGTFEIDGGKIIVAGKDVTSWPEYKRASMIGRVFQNPFSGTAPTMSIAENLALASKRGKGRGLGWALRSDFRASLKERVRQLNMDLEQRLDNAIGTLSGGQRQALTLIMAAWRKPQLLLLDEHTAALDPRSADQVIQISEEIISKEKITTMMVTHSMHQAINLGDRLIMMHKGKIIHDFSGSEKKRLRVDDLLARFREVRRKEQLDEAAAQMLREKYV